MDWRQPYPRPADRPPERWTNHNGNRSFEMEENREMPTLSSGYRQAEKDEEGLVYLTQEVRHYSGISPFHMPHIS